MEKKKTQKLGNKIAIVIILVLILQSAVLMTKDIIMLDKIVINNIETRNNIKN